MRLHGFIGNSYSLPDLPVECQRTINLYAQIDESQNGVDGEVGYLVSTPGLRLLATVGTGPIRGEYTLSNGAQAVVSGSEIYQSTALGVYAKAGDILTASGPVSMADNGTQLCIVDGANGYIVSLSTGTVTQITSAGWTGADTVTFQDGYFIFNNPGTGQFYWSDLYDGLNEDPLNFITAEGSPDNTVAVLSNQRQLWVAGAKTIEVFWNSGSETTFSRIDGAFIEYGCGAAQSLKKLANSIIWLGGGQNGAGIVWMAVGFQPKRISNHAVEYAIQKTGDISGATAWVYQVDGHNFYCLNLPGADVTWVFDISTGQWHERAYLVNGEFQRHRAECYSFAFDTHIVGDYENGNLYALDPEVRSDNGQPLKWVRRAPHLGANRKRIFYSRAELVARVGTGLDAQALYAEFAYGEPDYEASDYWESGILANKLDPSVELRYSDDYGNTWSTPRRRSLGKIGEYAKRVYWDQLGQSRNRTFEISGSDPVKIALLGMELTAKPGVS